MHVDATLTTKLLLMNWKQKWKLPLTENNHQLMQLTINEKVKISENDNILNM